MLLLENCGAQENKRMIPANYSSCMAEHMPLGTAVVDNSLFISIFPMLGAMIRFDMIPITQGFQAAAISSEWGEMGKISEQSTAFQTKESTFLQRNNTHFSKQHVLFFLSDILNTNSPKLHQNSHLWWFSIMCQPFPILKYLCYACCIQVLTSNWF